MSLRPARVRAAAAVLTALLIVTASASTAFGNDIAESKGFRKAVTVAGIREHQAALQAIADANNGIRLAGTNGYDESAEYVYEHAAAAGYDVSYQEFEFLLVSDRTPPVFQQISPTAASYVDGVDFGTMQYSGSGDVTAPVALPAGNALGCYAADFAGFPAGSIALVQRGTPAGFPGGVCTFRIKADNAMAAGATAVLIYNNVPGGGAFGTLGAPMHALPVLSVSLPLGQELAALVPGGLTVRVRTDTVAETRTTRNVIAETPGGDPDNVVVVGAHLDSVSRGPGINDNGSGSGTILEIAEVYAAQDRTPRNKLRFIWFGAEELGLVGSNFYVASLDAAEREQIMAMVNFDMVGSPNYVRFVYDGDGSATSPAGPPGSGFIEDVFVDYFNSQGLASDPTQFSGRSDYGPFIAVGIPAGGLFTGAEVPKTVAQAQVYGGTAGLAYDPCYHLACDTFAGTGSGAGATAPGLGIKALDELSDAAAHAVLFLSRTKVDIGATAAAALRTSGSPASADFDDHDAVTH